MERPWERPLKGPSPSESIGASLVPLVTYCVDCVALRLFQMAKASMPPTAAAAINASVHQGKAAGLLAESALSAEISGVAGFSMAPDEAVPPPGVVLVLLLEEVAAFAAASELLPPVGVLASWEVLPSVEAMGTR